MGEISLSKEGLATVAANFGESKESINTTLEKIKSSLSIIDAQWSGPEHDTAIKDKEGALENMNKAQEIVANMEGALNQLSANAGKISYNG